MRNRDLLRRAAAGLRGAKRAREGFQRAVTERALVRLHHDLHNALQQLERLPREGSEYASKREGVLKARALRREIRALLLR